MKVNKNLTLLYPYSITNKIYFLLQYDKYSSSPLKKKGQHKGSNMSPKKAKIQI